jgi:CHAT domain-containing protein
VLALLDSPQARPISKDSLIEILAITSVAHSSLHRFLEAENEIDQAERLCKVSSERTCGDVIRARGILAVQQGQIETAKQFFEQSLQFARRNNDRFLEITALLNLGLTSLREEHFDQAIDWTDAAYQASTALGAGGEAQVALGNLGWAYYNLGDSEKSLGLSLQAEKLARQAGKPIDQLYWITNAGYVYSSLGDFRRAEESYLKALDLATGINTREGIYNALRALALVSAENGDLTDAHKYSNEAIAIARADNNRTDELYPLFVNGLIAARSHNEAEAEHIFREVENDQKSSTSLKWRAEHGLAKLYEAGRRSADADREYRAAIATFEAARALLQRADSRLPFSNNASRIYDDYVHFLVMCGRTDDALRWADYGRARTLTEGLGLLAKGPSNGPPRLDSKQIARRAKATVLFYWLGEKQSFLWTITPRKTILFPLPAASEIEAAVQRYRQTLGGPIDVLESADNDGLLLYRMLIAPALSLLPKDSKVFIVPDGGLNNLNFETLLVSAPQPHYWIEDVTISNASSLRVLGALPEDSRKRDRSLLLMGNSLAPNDKYFELPGAAAQMEIVAKHFPAAPRRIITRGQATPQAYLDSNPEQFSDIHFVAHGTASRLSPLDSAIVLSKGGGEDDSFKLYARDIIRHPLRANLVTISACNSAGDRSFSGEGLVGLSWAFLMAGAHNVVAALWEVQDASTSQFMDKFYDQLSQGATPDVALRAAKLSLLRDNKFRNPFYWASFQLYSRLD